MDSPWNAASRPVIGRRSIMATAAAMAGFIVLLWNLSGSHGEWPSHRLGVGDRPSSPAWTLVVAGTDNDVLWRPADGLAELSASAPFGSSPVTTIVRPSPPEGSIIVELRRMVLELANTERRQHGCSPLRADPQLRRSAQSHADDMAIRNYYDHNTPEGAGPGSRMRAAGYQWSGWAENLLRGSFNPASTVGGWMASQGHRRNLLNCAWTDTGIGVNLSSTGPWWAQDFAVRS
ncbi:CAP domain-containing protein [Streptomyces netropsis]